MTRYGLISDIHTNINSLLCAFTVLDNCAVDFLYHLGDIAGGMHNSNQTIEALIKKGVQGVMGNHDLAELCCHSEPLSPRTRDYLVNLPEKMEREDIVFTPENPLDITFGQGYWIKGSYIRNREDAKRVFAGTTARIIVVGHTHSASAFSDQGEEYYFVEDGRIKLNSGKRYILNPGSVGRPRDGCTSSLGILDTGKRTFEVIRF